jgi:hypothetical protein
VGDEFVADFTARVAAAAIAIIIHIAWEGGVNVRGFESTSRNRPSLIRVLLAIGRKAGKKWRDRGWS